MVSSFMLFSMKNFDLFLVAILAVNAVTANHVVFDQFSDITKVADISCTYLDDYADFWVYGCPKNPSQDIYPEVTGFWTGCNSNCEIVYYGGLLPRPKNLWLLTYMEGDVNISFSGKANYEDPEFDQDFGQIIGEYQKEWCYKEIDLTTFPDSDASVINFTLDSSPNGLILVDKVVLDFGDTPISPITLEVIEDEQWEQHWQYDNCDYMSDYRDFWVLGCPVESETDKTEIGYWSACQKTSCKIEYVTSPAIIPSSVTIKGYLEGDGEIKVMGIPLNTKSSNILKGVVLKTISINTTAGGEWIHIDFDLTPYNSYKVDIVLEPKGGNVVLDALVFNFDSNINTGEYLQNDFPPCNQEAPTPDPTATTDENTATTDENTADPSTVRTTPQPSSETTTPNGPSEGYLIHNHVFSTIVGFFLLLKLSY